MEMRVRSLGNLLNEEKELIDKRGKQPTVNDFYREVLEKIKAHIKPFSVKNKIVKYLDGRLDIKTMHDIFKKMHSESKVNYKY